MSLQKIRKTNFLCPKWKFIKIHLDVMNIVSQKTRIFSFFIIKSSLSCKNAKILPKFFLFRVSRNCEIFAQISISCLATFREIRRKFRWNFREITKTKIFSTTLLVCEQIWKTFSRDSVPLISTHKAYTTCEIA